MTDRSEFNRLVALSEEDLTEQIGQALIGRRALNSSRKRKIQAGESWLEANSNAICRAICSDARIKALFLENKTETIEFQVIVTVADIVAPFVIGFPPATLAVLLAKRGIPKLCLEFWTAP